MTRKDKIPNPRYFTRDRHLQRNGITDLRGIPKKEGAGQHNWGKPTDALSDQHYEYHEEMPKYNKEKVQDTKAADTNRDIGKLKKIQVMKPEEFEVLRANNSNSDQ
jgi:hypothetical protein